MLKQSVNVKLVWKKINISFWNAVKITPDWYECWKLWVISY